MQTQILHFVQNDTHSPCHPEELFATKDLSITLWVNAKADASPSADGRVSLLTDQHDNRFPVILKQTPVILMSFSRGRISLALWVNAKGDASPSADGSA